MADLHGPLDKPVSDGDIQSAESLWPHRRRRQRQAASNYAVLLARVLAREEQQAHLSNEIKHLTHTTRAQHELITNLTLRLQMLEKIYVFFDWSKVEGLVDQCFGHSSSLSSHSSPRTSVRKREPPGLAQPEAEQSPGKIEQQPQMQQLVDNEQEREDLEQQQGISQTAGKTCDATAIELCDMFEHSAHVGLQTNHLDVATEREPHNSLGEYRGGDAQRQPHHQLADGTGLSKAMEHRLHEMMLAMLTKLENG